jgi:hypothetical protein
MLRNIRPLWCVALSASVWLGTATAVFAQPTPQEWHKGTALSVFAGAASARGGTDGAAGLAIGWEFTPRFTLEGSGLWTAGRDVEGFSALAGTRINLLPPRGVVPFVSAAVGLHRATVDSTRDGIPDFYMRRMGMAMRAGTGGPQQTFTDFVSAVGGGVDVYLRRHLALRPDVRVLFVRADTGTRPIAVYGVHLSYHFEEHPITP